MLDGVEISMSINNLVNTLKTLWFVHTINDATILVVLNDSAWIISTQITKTTEDSTLQYYNNKNVIRIEF